MTEEKPVVTSPELVAGLKEEAKQFYEAGDQTSYLNMLREMSKLLPSNLLLKQNIVILEFQSSNSESAVEKLHSDMMEIVNVDNIESLKEEDINFSPYLHFNTSVLLYHSQEYEKAEQLLLKLLSCPSFSDPNNVLSIKARVLLVDVQLKAKKFPQAMTSIEQYESFKQQAEIDTRKSPSPRTSSPSTHSRSEIEELDSNLKIRMQMYKTLCCLCMRSFKQAKRECKLLFGLLGTSSLTHVGAMHLKAYQEYLRGNVVKAVNLIRSLPPSVSKKTQKVFETMGELVSAIIPNNEGCCQFYMGRPLWSALLFKKAILAFDQKITEKPLPVYALKYKQAQLECLYNFGLACLHAKDTDRAFHCLVGCTRHFGANPRLWLRIAECCIQKYKATNEFDMQWTEEKRNLLKSIKCSKDVPKLIMSEKFSGGERTVEALDVSKPSPTVQYGSYCITVALSLMKPTVSGNSMCLHVPPSNPLTSERAINSLHAAILCSGAFLALSAGDYTLAVKRSRELLAVPSVGGAYYYLGKQYLAQALFMAGYAESAISVCEETEDSIDLSYCVSPVDSHEDKKEEAADAGWANAPGGSSCDGNGARKPLQVWYPRDEPHAKMISVYNKACLLASAGRLDKADEVLRIWLTKTTGIVLPPEFLMLAVYLHIQRGNYSKAASLLREHSPTAPIS